MFDNCYQGKRILVTGHTGFKGTWLINWLLELGATVAGVANGIVSQPSLFETLNLEGEIEDHRLDIRDLDTLQQTILEFRPDFLFHLAAQPIVSTSYADPVDTISTNVLGTTHVLESLRHLHHPCNTVIITSDKCYENVEWAWGYKETDPLGGKDIYSGSKGAAEIIFHSYTRSFFSDDDCPIRLATARAGNVLGGGDWAKDRIVADAMRAWATGTPVEIRCPNATRPWQHVLEPLSGYLALGASLAKSRTHHGESFNFGPRAEQDITVRELLLDLGSHWNLQSPDQVLSGSNFVPFHEAGLLKLNCDKAQQALKWRATLQYPETIEFVSNWYREYYEGHPTMNDYTREQIRSYQRLAHDRKLSWTTQS